MYTYFSLPVPATPASIASYKSLRLASLQIDADSFSSKYTTEVAFTDETWHKRVGSPWARTFIAAIDPTSQTVGNEDVPLSSWVGTVTVLSPSAIPPTGTGAEAIEQVAMDGGWELYVLVALWVRPEHRGRGVAEQLVRRGIEWARTFADPKFMGNSGERVKVMMVTAFDDNASACSLYTRMGFRELEDVQWEKGQRLFIMDI